ncbi:peptidyl-tRNA hydrolase [Apiospora rasikravindrae]|uniref:peptidyl-tRNA hydrolase n=1 Tax=Apiospora rasikravindrae TaxID=990691 RepID=A0ABR1TX66_9PEZI
MSSDELRDEKGEAVSVFIVSLGNPPPHDQSRHSAGHILLKALQSHLGFPAFRRFRPFGNSLVTEGKVADHVNIMLCQCAASMNESGDVVAKAYRQFVSASATGSQDDGWPTLVVLHDEMELAPGQLRLGTGSASAKGHNGLKSVQQSLRSTGLGGRLAAKNGKFLRVGFGIGRPAGSTRKKEDVSAFVLGQLPESEREELEGCAEDLMDLLEEEITK